MYDQAFNYLDANKSDSAFLYFDKAKDLFVQQKDSLGVGKCLLNMAIISTDNGDYYGGQEISLSALPYFDKREKDQHIYIKSNLNNLGLATENLKDYNRAIIFYTEALNYITGATPEAVLKNNIANIYRKRKAYQQAINIYQSQLEKPIDEETYAMILSNLALTKWLQHPDYNAVPELLKALEMRKNQQNLLGLNASYAHLTDYYTKKKPDSALFYANLRYKNANILKRADDRLEALQKLIRLSSPSIIKSYFQTYQDLDDSVQTIRRAAKNQFALIRYETEKSKADNLVLQKDNQGKRYQIFILITCIPLLIIVGTLWYKKRKQRLELEAQNTIRNNKLKTSQKVHDVVANGLYRIMSKLDHQETLKDNPIINEIEELYEQSRDISYEKPELKNQPFNEKISETLKSFASENTRVALVGNSAALWEKVSEQAKDEIEHILQELMVNMRKHSQASDVVIKFEQVQQKINIYYTDNGIGIAGKPQPKNGLTNTGIRIDAIGGTITFDTKVEKGLKIQISFPVS
ncbi:MAG: ATP-binding protein [Sphingobacteriaceae bacterium]|nr:ATP-binding protein [Sphingobacteriaceae bacterium]